LAAGVCFIVGLLIVNLRLALYGVFTAGFVRTEYMLAGALFCFLIGFTQGAVFLSRSLANTALDNLRERKRLIAGFELVACASMLWLPVWVLSLISDYRLSFLHWRTWLIYFGLFFGIHFVGDFVKELFDFLKGVSADAGESFSPTKLQSVLYQVLSLLPFILITLTLYAHYAYPYFSPALGGGRKDQVLLVPTDEGREICLQMRLPVQPDGRTVGPVDILTESQDEVIVLPTQRKSAELNIRAIRLKRSLFNAVVNVSPKPPFLK